MLQSLPIRSLDTLGRRSITSASNIYRHGTVNPTKNLSEKPSRSGQNLSSRYVRLEKSVRTKEAPSKELEVTSDSAPSTTGPPPFNKRFVELFRGFELPEEPKPPSDNGELIFYFLFFIFCFLWGLDCYYKIAACLVAPFASTTFMKNRQNVTNKLYRHYGRRFLP